MAVKVAIVGGGVAGLTAALTLGNLGLDVIIFEAKSAFISGPPFCHLHAGGNLYREISDSQCTTLLRQSIDFAKLYPFSIDKRPTIFATPIYDPHEPLDLLDRLEILKQEYKELIQKDNTNKVLGEADNYYEIFSKEELLLLAKKEPLKNPQNSSDWMIPFAKNLDFNRIKFPIILIQEYGINLFRVAANGGLALENMPNVKILRDTKVIDVNKSESSYIVEYCGRESSKVEVDYLINAAGFKTGVIDDILGVEEIRLVEFKAAYTSIWEDRCDVWPEVIFHGIRGTNRGMGQFTPYCSGVVQLHAMTPDITLFSDGLVSSKGSSSYPKLDKKFIDIIDNGWDIELRDSRTKKAVEYLSNFFPKFKSAKVASKPLFGAQQIPGNDPTLRVAEVSFPLDRYARCEIVKVSSVNDMTSAIVKDIKKEFSLEFKEEIFNIDNLNLLDEDSITKRAKDIAKRLNYPEILGERCRKL